MSTATVQKPAQSTAVTKPPETTITYVPLGETEAIHLTLARVKQFLCIPTKSGKMPTDEQVVKYMMLCKAQSLNPWVNDAYLVGYDGKDGAQFSLITAHQSFLKRAEASPEFDGIESGVIVARGDAITERQGDLLLNGETLVGAWARVHRRDRSVPSYDALNLSTFNTGRSRWAADPAGMIVKCAEASALRKAFPSTLAAMYCKEEMDRNRDTQDSIVVDTRSKTDRMAERFIGQTEPAKLDSPKADSQPDATDLNRQHEPAQAFHQEIAAGPNRTQGADLLNRMDAARTAGEITEAEFAELKTRLNEELE
jgi:phage recombination protein Bet